MREHSEETSGFLAHSGERLHGMQEAEGSNPSGSTKIGRKLKLLFAIVSCHKNRQRREDCRATWLKDLNGAADYKFFLGQGTSVLEEDELQLDVPDDYNNLPIKVREICRWALEHGYDYMLKVDDDTYVFPERMFFNVVPHDYVGRHNVTSAAHCRKGFCSGFAYWLSRKAMEVMIYGKPDILWEDQWAGGWLSKHDILPHDDKRYHIGSMIPKPMWSQFTSTSACLAEMGRDGDMKSFHDVVKGTLTIPEPLPATGRNVQLDKSTPRVGQVIRAGSRYAVRIPQDATGAKRVVDPRTKRVFFSDVNSPRKRG